MEVRIYVDRHDALSPWEHRLEFSGITDAQRDRALAEISGRIREIFVPGPWCGGEVWLAEEDEFDNPWGWAEFDGFSLQVRERTIRVTLEFPIADAYDDHDHPPAPWYDFLVAGKFLQAVFAEPKENTDAQNTEA